MPPLALVALAWCVGLIVAHHWLVPAGVEPISLLLLALVPLIAILLWRSDRSVRLYGACALALLLGALRYQSHLPNFLDTHFVAHYNGPGRIELEGVVSAYPDVRDTWTNLRLDAQSLVVEGRRIQVKGKVLVRAPRYPDFDYGDSLRVTGSLEAPPELEGFSYREYLARQDIYSMVQRPHIERLDSQAGATAWSILFGVKDRARAGIARLLPEPEASLLQGMVLGIGSGIPAEVYEDFNATGTSHVLVISGTNISLVVVIVSAICAQFFGKRRAYWSVMAGIVFYVLLVGADTVVVRAGIMGGLFATALLLGRRATAHVSLFISVLVLTVVHPSALWDLGLQLSVAATLGLIVFTRPIRRILDHGLGLLSGLKPPEQGAGYLREVLGATLAAQVLVMPLLIYHFGRISLVAPLANLLIAPVQPAILVGGGLATLIGMIPPLEPLARIVAWVPWLCLTYTARVVHLLAMLPFATTVLAPRTSAWLAVCMGLLIVAGWFLLRRPADAGHRHPDSRVRLSTTVILGAPLAGALLVCLAVLQLPDGRLHVAFLDVGQGDAILITTPSGRQILIDGGPSPAALVSALGKEMPFWDRSIDLVTLTHPDTDHMAGLPELLKRYRVAGWIDSGAPSDDPLYGECERLLHAANVPRHVARSGLRFDLEPGLTIVVLHPDTERPALLHRSANDDSVVLALRWGDASFLFTGDIEAGAERDLAESGQPLSAAVLKVGHHGSAASTTSQFLSAVTPRFAVISVGADNRFGHPDPAVVQRLAQQGIESVIRTDQRGTIEFVTNGSKLQIRTNR